MRILPVTLAATKTGLATAVWRKGKERRQSHDPRVRQGAAAVEFALIAVLLVGLILGMIEISRGVMVSETLSNAARAGCRIGSQATGTNSQIINEAKTVLSDNNIAANSATVSILVNDSPGDVSKAQRQDKITVTISIPVSEVYWTSTMFLSDNFRLTESVVMMRQR